MSGYIERNIHAGETIEYTGRVSWLAALHRGAIVFVIGAVISSSVERESDGATLAGFFMIVGIVMLIRGAILVLTAEYAVTDRRVIGKYGLIRVQSVDVLFTAISGISTSTTFLGRFLGYGTVWVNGAGARSGLRDMSSPKKFQAAVHQRLDDSRLLKGTAAYTLKVEMAEPTAPPPPPPVPAPASSPAQSAPTAPAAAPTATGSYCRHCGTHTGTDARFCPGCGKAVA